MKGVWHKIKGVFVKYLPWICLSIGHIVGTDLRTDGSENESSHVQVEFVVFLFAPLSVFPCHQTLPFL